MNAKLLLPLLATALLAAPAAFAMGQRPDPAQVPGEPNPADSIADMEEAAGHVLHLGSRLALETPHGKVVIATFPKEAPRSVEQVLALAGKGFYDGLAIHRMVAGWVVQLGDPLTRTLAANDPKVGRGGSGQALPPEFQGQKVKHLEGTVGMARGADPNSADSQFYITLAASPHLDGKYTVIGQVVGGMDAVRKLALGDKVVKVTATAPVPAEK